MKMPESALPDHLGQSFELCLHIESPNCNTKTLLLAQHWKLGLYVPVRGGVLGEELIQASIASDAQFWRDHECGAIAFSSADCLDDTRP